MYYGNDTVSSQEDVDGVWESSAELVYHFDEDSGDAIDSTSNHNDGAVYGATQDVPGNISSAYDFERSDDDYIEIPADSSLNSITGETTVLAWINLE